MVYLDNMAGDWEQVQRCPGLTCPDPTGPALTVTPAGWAAFTGSIHVGEFD